MALQKTVVGVSGDSGNYWPIRSLELLPRQDAVAVHILMFKDRATSEANKTGTANTREMAGQRYAIMDSDYDAALKTAVEAVMALVYPKLKLLEKPVDFTVDTVDVLE